MPFAGGLVEARASPLGLAELEGRRLNEQDIVAAIPAEIRDAVAGSVLYSGRSAWVRSTRPEIYLLGYNPGGVSGSDANTLGQQAAKMLEAERWSSYEDESWGPAKGMSPMQVRIRDLFRELKIDLRGTPASNVVFARSSQIAHLEASTRRQWETVCWQFHKTMIEHLQPKIVLVLGNEAEGFVRTQQPPVPVVKVRHTSRSARSWGLDAAPIVRAALDRARN